MWVSHDLAHAREQRTPAKFAQCGGEEAIRVSSSACSMLIEGEKL